MDTIQHAYDGYVIAKAFEVVTGADLSLSVEICSALVGALPDLIGEAERLVKRNPALWGWYNKVHLGKAYRLIDDPVRGHGYYKSVEVRTWWWYLRFVPQWGEHILKDRFTHASMGAKRNWYPPSQMWKENFWKALAYCWPNWIGWTESIAVHVVVILL